MVHAQLKDKSLIGTEKFIRKFQTAGMSLGACKLTCEEHAVLWPKPRESALGKEVTAFSPDNIEFANKEDYTFGSESARMVERGIAEQVEWLKKKKLGRKSIELCTLIFLLFMLAICNQSKLTIIHM